MSLIEPLDDPPLFFMKTSIKVDQIGRCVVILNLSLIKRDEVGFLRGFLEDKAASPNTAKTKKGRYFAIMPPCYLTFKSRKLISNLKNRLDLCHGKKP